MVSVALHQSLETAGSGPGVVRRVEYRESANPYLNGFHPLYRHSVYLSHEFYVLFVGCAMNPGALLFISNRPNYATTLGGGLLC